MSTPLPKPPEHINDRRPKASSQFPGRQACRPRDDCVPGGLIWALLFFCIGLAAQAQKSPASAPPPLGALLDIGGYRVHVYCTPTCRDRVAEISRVIQNESVEGNYILVGYSVGALWERLYAARYPTDIVGMVIVDHAFLPDNKVRGAHQASAPISSRSDSAPVLITQAPLVFGFEDDVNIGRLPQRDVALHAWALAQHPVRPDETMAADCFAQIDHAIGNHSYPLGDMPLTVIRTENESPAYAELQAKLLSLSHRSRQVIAWNSSHMVPIDEPEVIISAIQTMVETTRGHKN